MGILWRFEGRIGRGSYWGYSILTAAIHLLLMAFLFAVPVVGMLLLGSLIVSKVSLVVRRLHDRNKSGWWALIELIPVIGEIWLLVELGFLPGDRYRNDYGLPEGMSPVEEEAVRFAMAYENATYSRTDLQTVPALSTPTQYAATRTPSSPDLTSSLPPRF